MMWLMVFVVILFLFPVGKKSYFITVIMVDNIQLLASEALDMKCYRPKNNDIYRGEAEVNIGILRSISLHFQCLNSQQLIFLYNFSN